LSKVLKPIKDMITCLESKTANLADCYLGYLKLAIAIKNIFQDHHLMFYRKCVSIFNERFNTFDYDEYLLAYYLHPQYRGAGIKQSQFVRIAGIAGRLWIKMKSNTKKSGLEMLKAQLRQYACNEEPYNGSYVSTIDSPVRWWKTTRDGIETKPGALSSLAIKLFSVRPHVASCERVWSRCGWFSGDRRTNLGTKNLESMVKISSYLMSNAKQELHYYGLELTERELQTVFQDIDLFSEVNEENNDNLDNLSEFTNFSDPEIEHQDLALENFIELNKVEPDADDENIDRNNEELDEEEFVSEEFDENKFGAEVEELVYSIQ
ncbi:7303_t:CDS:2, partial [Cetraspora pellucida]